MPKKRTIKKLKKGDYLDTGNYQMGAGFEDDPLDTSNATPGEAGDSMDDGIDYMDAGSDTPADEQSDYQDAGDTGGTTPYSPNALNQNQSTLNAFNAVQTKQSNALQALKDAQARATASLQPKADKSAMWLAIASGLLSPTRTGSFGESVGNAAGNAAPYEQHYADADQAARQSIANLDYGTAQDLYKDASKPPQIIDWYARNGAGAIGKQKALIVNGQPIPFGEVFTPGGGGKTSAFESRMNWLENATPEQRKLYEQYMPKPAQTSVNVNSGVPYETESQKKAADRFDDLVKQADTSRQLAAQLNAVAPYIEKTPGVYFGPGGGGLVTIGKGLKQIGFDVGDGLDTAGFVQSIMSHLGPAQRIQGSGSSSDRDVALFMQSLPGLANTKPGNRMLIKYYNKINDYNQRLLQVVRKAQKEHGDWYGIDDLTKQEIDSAGRIFSDADLQDMQTAAGGNTPKPGTPIPTVSTRNNKDGTVTLSPGAP